MKNFLLKFVENQDVKWGDYKPDEQRNFGAAFGMFFVFTGCFFGGLYKLVIDSDPTLLILSTTVFAFMGLLIVGNWMCIYKRLYRRKK